MTLLEGKKRMQMPILQPNSPISRENLSESPI